jgi:hypothetical protein
VHGLTCAAPPPATARRREVAIDPSDVSPLLTIVGHLERDGGLRCDAGPIDDGRRFVLDVREAPAATVALLELLFAKPYRAAAYARLWLDPKRPGALVLQMARRERERLEVMLQLDEMVELGLLAEDADGRLHARGMACGGEA